jgi:Flp pilus assembly secretin CpaC
LTFIQLALKLIFQPFKASFTIVRQGRSCQRRPEDLMRREPYQALRASRVLAVGALLLSGLCAAPAPADAQVPINIVIDRAKVMHISRPADTIIIGNPAIADATIQDNQTLIITGRSYGSTNLIVLDADGQPIADEVLQVQDTDEAIVTVFKRASRETLSCTPQCAPTLTIGDNNSMFEVLNTQVDAHNASSGAAGN